MYVNKNEKKFEMIIVSCDENFPQFKETLLQNNCLAIQH